MADEIRTFDEILADPTYKAEFDRRITKALSTVQSKLDAEVEKNKQFLANGNAETDALKKGQYIDGDFRFPLDFLHYYKNYDIGIPYEYEAYLKEIGVG